MPNCRIYRCKASRESCQVRSRTHCALVGLLNGRRLCVSVVGKLAGPAGTPTCCRLISSTVSWVTWGTPAVFVNGLQRWILFDCSVLAPLHTGIPWKQQAHFKTQWKTNQALWIYSQISFVFPSFMGKTDIVVPCC